MPEMNGIDLLGKIRPKYPDLVIIIFTGMGYEEDLIAAARAAGANGYVSKGLGPSELYKTIIRIISIKKET
jgi:DNA-binding NarL/FixJ family response regulator